jgi:hypothetical protein
VDDWFQDRELSLKGAKIIVQGFGNVGSFAAEILSGMGAKIIAVQDADGSIFNPNGLDVGALMTYVYENKENLKKSVAGFPGGESLGRDDFWSVECDVCIPAALGNVINGEVAERMRCKLVAEGANHPTTPDADEVFLKRGIDLIPDVIANAGGVTVSYYEWVQNKRIARVQADGLHVGLLAVLGPDHLLRQHRRGRPDVRVRRVDQRHRVLLVVLVRVLREHVGPRRPAVRAARSRLGGVRRVRPGARRAGPVLYGARPPPSEWLPLDPAHRPLTPGPRSERPRSSRTRTSRARARPPDVAPAPYSRRRGLLGGHICSSRHDAPVRARAPTRGV